VYACLLPDMITFRSLQQACRCSFFSEAEDTKGQGKTSLEIASNLSISRRTAEAHRANGMKKLGLRTQTDGTVRHPEGNNPRLTRLSQLEVK